MKRPKINGLSTSQFVIPEVIVIAISASGIRTLISVVKTGHDGVGDLLDLFPAGSELVRVGIWGVVEPIQRFIDGELELLVGCGGSILKQGG